MTMGELRENYIGGMNDIVLQQYIIANFFQCRQVWAKLVELAQHSPGSIRVRADC